MARPRYSAAKRAREIRKQEERARKLARKHNRLAEPQAPQAPAQPEGVIPGPEITPGPEGKPSA